jgi:hypothetical protein
MTATNRLERGSQDTSFVKDSNPTVPLRGGGLQRRRLLEIERDQFTDRGKRETEDIEIVDKDGRVMYVEPDTIGYRLIAGRRTVADRVTGFLRKLSQERSK